MPVPKKHKDGARMGKESTKFAKPALVTFPMGFDRFTNARFGRGCTCCEVGRVVVECKRAGESAAPAAMAPKTASMGPDTSSPPWVFGRAPRAGPFTIQGNSLVNTGCVGPTVGSDTGCVGPTVGSD